MPTTQEWVLFLLVTVVILLFPRMRSLGDNLGRLIEKAESRWRKRVASKQPPSPPPSAPGKI